MLPAQRAELQKGRVSMSTGNLPLTKTIRSSHANHEASSIDIVQQQRKFGKVILRRLLKRRLERQGYVMMWCLCIPLSAIPRLYDTWSSSYTQAWVHCNPR